MKKISIFSTLLAGVVAFSACTPEIEPAEKPISYDPVDSAKVVANVTAADFANPIDLGTYEADFISAFTVDLAATPELGAGDKVSYKMHTSDTEEMAKVKDLAVKVEGNTLKVSKAELNDLMKSFFGKRPAQNTIYVKVRTILTASTGANIEFISEPFLATITTTADLAIEESYYINVAGEQKKMSHSKTDVYEDPVFKATVSTTQDATEWYVTSESGIKFGAGAQAGSLAQDGTSLVLDTIGNYDISVNMETLTYTVEKAPDVIEYFVVGDFSGWSQTDGQRLYSVAGAPAEGWLVLNGAGANGWKISSQADWAGTNYGAGEEGTAEAAQLILDTAGDAPNITQYSGFSYKVSFDPANFTLSILNTVDIWGLVGSFNGWGAPDVAMALSTEPGMDYLVATVTLEAGAEFKIRANEDWAINFGDAGDGTLKQDGSNITVAEAGDYEVRFYFCAQTPYYTVTKL